MKPPPNGRPPAAPQYSPRVTSVELRLALCVAARSAGVRADALRMDWTQVFRQAEAAANLFWTAVVGAARVNGGRMPDDPGQCRTMFNLAVAQTLARDVAKAYFPDPVRDEVLGPGGWAEQAYEGSAPAPELERAAVEVLQRFLLERKVNDPLQLLLAPASGGTTLADPQAVMAEMTKAWAGVAGFGADAGGNPISASHDFLPTPVVTTPTGVPMLDEVMGGGHAPGELNFVMAPTSGGKSSLMTQIFVEGGRIEAARYRERNGVGPKRLWVYFSYEMTFDQMKERVYAYGAKISRGTMNVPTASQAVWSTAASLKPYETDPFVNPPGCTPVGELERIRAFGEEMGEGWLDVVDYQTGLSKGVGTGGVPEMAAYLTRKTAMGFAVAGVIVDYAGLVVSRLRSAKNFNPDSEYTLLNSFGDDCRSLIGTQFNCPVWVVHQCHGDVNGMSPGARLHLKQGRGGRNLGDNSDFAFMLGNMDRKTDMCAWWVEKHRRVRWNREVPIITRYDGRFSAFLRPAGDWTVDPYTKDIVERQVAAGLTGSGLPPVPRV